MDQGAKGRHIHRPIHGLGESTVRNPSKGHLIPGVYDFMVHLAVCDHTSLCIVLFCALFWVFSETAYVSVEGGLC